MVDTQFDHRQLEAHWSRVWKEIGQDVVNLSAAQKPFYNLMMFPYPSAEGLHVGNMYAFTGSDIYGRFKRMQGYDVFEPIGLDGFGIHSENFALKIGRHPFEHAKITESNYYTQLTNIGAMFDWNHTVETYKENYYRYTQWLFITLFKAGLIYRSNATVNWCLSCKTVLADEQVIDGACERCSNDVIKKELTQWFCRITAYAEKLDRNLKDLQWTEKVKIAQKHWIGKKVGIDIEYEVYDATGKAIDTLTCFTTRPETNFGASFVVVAPEHPFITRVSHLLDKKELDLVVSYQNSVKTITEIERNTAERTKTGVKLPFVVKNRLTGDELPIYVSDFVLMSVGSGAVVGVPGHDSRDFDFAQVFSLPVKRVVVGEDGNQEAIVAKEQVEPGSGIIVNSDFLNGKTTTEAAKEIVDYLVNKGWGKKRTMYHLRDWIISRQRFWGPPIPMIYCQACADAQKHWFSTTSLDHNHKKIESKDEGNSLEHNHVNDPAMNGWYPVPNEDLPVALPYIEDFQPGEDGIPPLQKHKEFYETTCPGCGGKAVRSTEVSDTFLDSSWYFLRYPSVQDQVTTEPFDQVVTKKWLPVDMYTGGAEHSVLHLLYARFVTMALQDLGYIDFEEPFKNFFAHGLVIKDGAKMSKSKGNVVNPDEYIRSYGADALRLYLMFMGPYSEGGDFRDSAMEGMAKWVGRVVRLASQLNSESSTNDTVKRSLHRLIKKVGDDAEKRRYNTAIASMMEFTNLVSESNSAISIDDLRIFLRLLAPFAPFVTEHLHQTSYGRSEIQIPTDSIHHQSWPSFDPDLLIDETTTLIVQVNGKLRGNLVVSQAVAADKEASLQLAKELPNLLQYLSKGYKTVIFVPGKLLNFVV